MRPAVQVRKRNVHGLVLLLGRGESFRNMVDKEHEDVSQDQSYSNVRVRTRTFHLLDVLAVVLVLLGPVHACVAFLVAFCRVIIAALLRLVVLLLFNFLLLFCLLLQLLRPLDSKLNGSSLLNNVASWHFDGTNPQQVGIQHISSPNFEI